RAGNKVAVARVELHNEAQVYIASATADLGSIDYGRNSGVLYDVASITDYAPIFDIMTSSSSGWRRWRTF
ncbi:porin, partial [Klebsiella pneumoniae]